MNRRRLGVGERRAAVGRLLKVRQPHLADDRAGAFELGESSIDAPRHIGREPVEVVIARTAEVKHAVRGRGRLVSDIARRLRRRGRTAGGRGRRSLSASARHRRGFARSDRHGRMSARAASSRGSSRSRTSASARPRRTAPKESGLSRPYRCRARRTRDRPRRLPPNHRSSRRSCVRGSTGSWSARNARYCLSRRTRTRSCSSCRRSRRRRAAAGERRSRLPPVRSRPEFSSRPWCAGRLSRCCP